MARQTFDPDSGQVFSETIVRAEKSETPWEYQTHSRSSRVSPFTNSAMCSSVKSLQDLCLQKLADRANSLQVETLEGLPHAIAIRIWQHVRKERRESFHVWRAFVKAGFWEPGHKHAIAIDAHNVHLMHLFDSLSDPLGAWMVDLTLKNAALTAAEFKEVSRLANLQQLHVQYSTRSPSSNFDDKIVEAWSTRAKCDGAFSRLESLSVAHASAVTSHVIKHISGFPALGHFVHAGNAAFGKRAAKMANQYGWIEIPLLGTAQPQRLLHQEDRAWDYLDSVLENVKRQLSYLQTDTPRVDVLLQSHPPTSRIVGESHVCRFRRFEDFALAISTDHVAERPIKQRRLNNKKGSEFISMLAQMR